MSCNHNNSYHISTDNTITTWQDIIGDPKKNKTMAQILRDVLKKVDKEDGKCLIPVEELVRIRTLYNYDDTYVQAQIRNIQELLDNLDLPSMRSQIYSLEMAIYDVEQELEAQRRRMEEMQRQLDEAAKKTDIPTKVSQLSNDSGFITDADIPKKVSDLENDSEFVTKDEVPTKVSDLQNDAGFVDQQGCEQICEQAVEIKVENINPLIYDDLD